MNFKPNFAIIGAQKSGTTTLYEYLKQHPDIYMSKPKEPVFFADDKLYNKGFQFYINKFFKGYNGQKMVGEASTAYSYYIDLQKTVKRIFEFNKDMKLIYVLRNPIERALSSYWWNVRIFIETLTFEKALKLEEKRENTTHILDPWSYKRKGLYFHVIQTYLKYFPKKNLYVVLLDDLKTSPQLTCNEIFNFLHVSKFQIKAIPKKNQNPSALPKNKLIYLFIRRPNMIMSAASFLITHTLGEKIKGRIDDYINEKSLKSLQYPPMKESTFDFLRDYYENDIKQLEKFLHIDLNCWLNSKNKICKKLSN